MKNGGKPVVRVVQGYLLEVLKRVNAITNPATHEPLQIPDFSNIYQAAERLDSVADPATFMATINSLLGRASSVGCDAPTASYALSFPTDHHMHATMGTEWYWIGCHLNVVDPQGNTGRLSLLLSMEKIRAIGVAAQQAAGWSALEASIATNIVTVTVDMGPGKRSIHRRSPNVQWPVKGGVAHFSQPGDDDFHFVCGTDSLRGALNVLPLAVSVNDGHNMAVALELTPPSTMAAEKAFFLQGVPKPGSLTGGGTGFTPAPTPGLYYSWPQLQVSGTVTVGGICYTVVSGTGWIDHEVMMTSLDNPEGNVHPVPFAEDPAPYNGWVWQFYNLDNGQAFTGAGFIQGEMNDNPTLAYGYFLTPKDGGWEAIFINGQINLLYPNAFPSRVGTSSPAVDIPIVRAYRSVENTLLGKPLSGVATPWFFDGTFNGVNGALCAEFPADYIDLSGQYANGLGYMESVGFESGAAYQQYALALLKR
jgi:CrtC N-terminal lipocalin domain